MKQKSAEVAELRTALETSRSRHTADVMRLTQSLQEAQALVEQARAAEASPLYLWPSIDAVDILHARYAKLDDSHTDLQAKV